MPAIHREIVYYLIEQLQHKPAEILIIGNDKDSFLPIFPSQYKVEGIPTSTFREIKTDKQYDALLVNDALKDLNYRELELFIERILMTMKKDAVVEIHQDLSDSTLNLAHYTDFFDSVRFNDSKDKCVYGFKILWEQGLRDTIYHRQDWQDHCWMLLKNNFGPIEQSGRSHSTSVRDFLDKHQYTQNGIKAYEWIFGHGFISPGGEEQNGKFLAQIGLKPGENVLDIGCGIAGNAFQMAKEYGVHVMGVDLSSNMVTISCERACLKKDTRVRFLIADITQFNFEPNTFDVVYSRDCIIHIPDKSSLFNKIYKWLKPGGKLLITDYMVGEKEHTEEFNRYLADRQYGLRPLKDYENAAKSAGFKNVIGQDVTDQLLQLIQIEMTRATENKKEFMKMFTESDYEHLLQGWKNKVGYINSGDQKWGLISAVKPE